MGRRGFVVAGMLVSGVVATLGAQTLTPDQPPAPAAVAPAPPPSSRRPVNRNDLRKQIYVMEGALARAVQSGAQLLNREIRNVSAELVMLAGEAQARGVYLEGYGVYFDVGVPILRQSMMWSLRTMLDQDDRGLRELITWARASMNSERDPARRQLLENAIARLELQVGPSLGRNLAQRAGQGAPPLGGSGVGAAMVPPDTLVDPGAPISKGAAPVTPAAPGTPPAAPDPMTIDRMFLQDPNRAYTEAVQKALIDAMIDYAMPMQIGPDEWITIAARDNEPRDTLAPPDPLEEVVTVILSIKGADIAAYRTAMIDRDEARRRVQIKEF